MRYFCDIEIKRHFKIINEKETQFFILTFKLGMLRFSLKFDSDEIVRFIQAIFTSKDFHGEISSFQLTIPKKLKNNFTIELEDSGARHD